LTRRDLLGLSLAFLLTLPAVTTRLYASDEVEYFAWLRSVAFDRDVDFENEYQHFYDSGVAHSALFHETFLERTNEAGRRKNYTTVGSAILWAPFYGVGHLAALATGAPADGYSPPYVKAVAYGSACYGFAAVLLSAAIARRLIGHGLSSTIAIWLGTPLLFYMYVAPVFSHACSAFGVALFLWVWLRVRDGWSIGGAVLLGLCGALMAMVREQDLFFVIGPALDFARTAWLRREWPIAPAAAATAAFAIGYLPQLAGSLALLGHAGPARDVQSKMTWSAPHAVGVLFSTGNGFFFWTPLALLAAAGLALLAYHRAYASDTAWVGRLALLMFLIQVYITGSVESWTSAGGFGQRRFVALTPLLVLGLAGLADAWRRSTRARAWPILIATVLCVWWNLGLIVQFGANRMSRDHLTLKDNAITTFVRLPIEGPGLVWRYLTNRASFYGQPRQ